MPFLMHEAKKDRTVLLHSGIYYAKYYGRRGGGDGRFGEKNEELGKKGNE